MPISIYFGESGHNDKLLPVHKAQSILQVLHKYQGSVSPILGMHLRTSMFQMSHQLKHRIQLINFFEQLRNTVLGYVYSAHDVNSVVAAKKIELAYAGHCCTIEKETEETEYLQLQFKSTKTIITFGKKQLRHCTKMNHSSACVDDLFLCMLINEIQFKRLRIKVKYTLGSSQKTASMLNFSHLMEFPRNQNQCSHSVYELAQFSGLSFRQSLAGQA